MIPSVHPARPSSRLGAVLLAVFNEFITDTIATYGYLAIFLLMVLESACIPIPSEVTMVFEIGRAHV